MSWTPVNQNTKPFQVLGATTYGYGTYDAPLELYDYLIGGKPRVPGDWRPGTPPPGNWQNASTT